MMGLKGRTRLGLASAAGLGLLLAAVAPASADEFGTSAFKCEGDFAKGAKIANFVEKFVNKCTTDYVKRNLFLGGEKGKPLPDTLFKSGELCQSFVNDKAIATVNAGIATSNCTDANLRVLGHFDSSIGSGLAGDLATMDALRHGLQRAAAANPDLWEIMEAVGDLSTTPCTACNTLRNALFDRGIGPCAAYFCRIAGSSINVGIPVTAVGSLNAELCKWNPVFGDNIALFSGPSRSVSASLGSVNICVDSSDTRGFIAATGGGLNAADIEVCQDHLVPPTGACSVTSTFYCTEDADCPATETCVSVGEADECRTVGLNGVPFTTAQCSDTVGIEGHCSTTTATLCDQDSDCPASETCNLGANSGPGSTTPGVVATGGACARLRNAAAATNGEAMIRTVLINTVVSAATAGTDATPCTTDDLADPAAPTAVVLTTEDADGIIYDENRIPGVDLNVATSTGTAFTLTGANSIEAGKLSSGSLVSIFPALSLNAGIAQFDALTRVTLTCNATP